MTANEKETLLALIRGLSQTQGQTQYDNGEKVIRGRNLELLIDAIKRM